MLSVNIKTPLGIAILKGDADGLKEFTITENSEALSATEIPPELEDAVYQITEYFNGTRTSFDVKLNPNGTDFQKRCGMLY